MTSNGRVRLLAALGSVLLFAVVGAAPVWAQGTGGPAGTYSVMPTPDSDINNPKNPARDRVPASRAWFSLHGEPGATIHDSLRVTNTGPVPLDLLVYPVDAATGVSSGMVLLDREAPRSGVSRWVQLATGSLQLAPGGTRDVDFTVAIPPGARGGENWGGLMVEDTNVRAAGGQFGVSQVMRTGVTLGVTLPGERIEKLAVRGITEKVVNDLHQVFVIDIANEGNVMVKPTGDLVFTDADGNRVARVELRLDNVLAGGNTPYELFWPGEALPEGKYSAKVTLQSSPLAVPASLTVPNLEVQAPANRLVESTGDSGNRVLTVERSQPAGESPLRTLIPAVGGAAVVLLAMVGYRVLRRGRHRPDQ